LLKNKKRYEELTGKSRDLLSPREVNDFKKRFNHELSKAYQDVTDRIKMTPINKDAAMTINRNWRQFLEELIPEIPVGESFKLTNKLIRKQFPNAKKLSLGELNELQGKLIELRNAIAEESYKMTVGPMMDFQVGQKTATGAFVAGSAVRTITDDPSVITAAMAAGGGVGFVLGTIDSSTKLKSMIANYLNSLQSVGITTRPTGVLIRLGIYQSNEMWKSYKEEGGEF
jgi:hypothetical protein